MENKWVNRKMMDEWPIMKWDCDQPWIKSTNPLLTPWAFSTEKPLDSSDRKNEMACASGSSTSLLILLNQSRLGSQSQKGQQRIDSSLSFGSSLPFSGARRRTKVGLRRMAKPVVNAETMTIEKSGIKVVRNPPESKLTELGVRKWPKWGCPPSKFPWTYSAKETCYLLEGKVKVYPDEADEPVEITAGDLVEFPKGMSCTWDVSVGVDKHYNFE